MPQENFEHRFRKEWVSQEVTRETVQFAEDFGRFLKEQGLTTSQIRNAYGELKRIQMSGFEKEKVSFLLLKPKLAYAASRLRRNGQEEFRKVFDKMYDAVDTTNVAGVKQFDNLVNIMESIIAYHKAFGGR